ncbi:hypothetical protein [Polyangium mundeleinium]|uniref:Uncharacterized protein n=1 Tax=Polyangium mundeleinium TaxID=2995306 RepID=A0ABT5ELP9_9BACT|nr:hypothetical protein [Polyangium mundeleinium]MDC0742744.1 hypothetical protein [Polyangium mundeleinium]
MTFPVVFHALAELYRPREDHIRILAIAAHKRRPTYWHGRS